MKRNQAVGLLTKREHLRVRQSHFEAVFGVGNAPICRFILRRELVESSGRGHRRIERHGRGGNTFQFAKEKARLQQQSGFQLPGLDSNPHADSRRHNSRMLYWIRSAN